MGGMGYTQYKVLCSVLNILLVLFTTHSEIIFLFVDYPT